MGHFAPREIFAVTNTRDEIARELSTYLEQAGLASPWSYIQGASTRALYANEVDLYETTRLQLHEELIAIQLQKQKSVSKGGKIVVTAGPPGAGKSTKLAQNEVFAQYRDIDADDFKDSLLMRAAKENMLADWTSHKLGDGLNVSIRKLSGFVHAESTTIANRMREVCMSNREDVVIHGTLSSSMHATALLGELDSFEYNRLTIFDVETSQATAIERAFSRWWAVRDSGEDPLGGRFVPASAISSQFRSGSNTSKCAMNAQALYQEALAMDWNVDLKSVLTA